MIRGKIAGIEEPERWHVIRCMRGMPRTLAPEFLVLLLLAACGGTAVSEPAVDASVDTSLGSDGSNHEDTGAGHDASDVDALAHDGGAPDATPDASEDAPADAAIDNDPRCPPSYGATGACTIEGVTCRYPEGRCDCERPCSGVFIPDAGWSCTSATPQCPGDPPVKGSACANEGAHCTYPGCCTTNDFTCGNGKWDAAAPFCPP